MVEPIAHGWDGVPFHKYHDRSDRDHRKFDNPSEAVEPILSGGIGKGVRLFFVGLKYTESKK